MPVIPFPSARVFNSATFMCGHILNNVSALFTALGDAIGETGGNIIVTRRNCNKTDISRITYQTTTLFAQCMRYLNLHIVCKK